MRRLGRIWNYTEKKIQSTGIPNLRMRCHIKIGRATLPISGDKLTLTLSHANKTLLSHLSWFAGTWIRATKSSGTRRPVHFRRQQLFLPNSVNPRIRFFPCRSFTLRKLCNVQFASLHTPRIVDILNSNQVLSWNVTRSARIVEVSAPSIDLFFWCPTWLAPLLPIHDVLLSISVLLQSTLLTLATPTSIVTR